jgi:hypothetical protein
MVDSACVIGLFTSLEDAKQACENVNALRAHWKDLKDKAEDVDVIISELMDFIGPHKLTETIHGFNDEFYDDPGWSVIDDFHWMPSKSSVLSMIFVVQLVPNPYVEGEDECQNRDPGYHCGKHPR